MQQIANQQKAHDKIFSKVENFHFHTTNDLFIRYLRDRRLNIALAYLDKIYSTKLRYFSVLVVCGGVGGEAIFFKKSGFKEVTNSDLSLEAALTSKILDPTLDTVYANAESLPYENESFGIVVVQDGLHHLPRPVLGFNEMLRVAKHAVIVIEPRESWIGNLIGTKYEKHGEIENYVFRWSSYLFSSTTRSLLLHEFKSIKFIKLWDHNGVIRKITQILPKNLMVYGAKFIYSILSLFNFCGNMMVGIVVKKN